MSHRMSPDSSVPSSRIDEVVGAPQRPQSVAQERVAGSVHRKPSGDHERKADRTGGLGPETVGSSGHFAGATSGWGLVRCQGTWRNPITSPAGGW